MNKKLTIMSALLFVAYVVTMLILQYRLPAYEITACAFIAFTALYCVTNRKQYKVQHNKTKPWLIAYMLISITMLSFVRTLLISFSPSEFLSKPVDEKFIICGLSLLSGVMYTWMLHYDNANFYVDCELKHSRKKLSVKLYNDDTLLALHKVDHVYVSDTLRQNKSEFCSTVYFDGSGDSIQLDNPQDIVSKFLNKALSETDDENYNFYTSTHIDAQRCVTHDGHYNDIDREALQELIASKERQGYNTVVYMFSFKGSENDKFLISMGFTKYDTDFTLESLCQSFTRPTSIATQCEKEVAVKKYSHYFKGAKFEELTLNNFEHYAPKTSYSFYISQENLCALNAKQLHKVHERIKIVYGCTNMDDFPAASLQVTDTESRPLDTYVASPHESADIRFNDDSMFKVNEALECSDRLHHNVGILGNFNEQFTIFVLAVITAFIVRYDVMPLVLPLCLYIGIIKFIVTPLHLVGRDVCEEFKLPSLALVILGVISIVTLYHMPGFDMWVNASVDSRTVFTVFLFTTTVAMTFLYCGFKTNPLVYVLYALLVVSPMLITNINNVYTSNLDIGSPFIKITLITYLIGIAVYPVLRLTSVGGKYLKKGLKKK